eukprot:304739_1
MFPRYNDRILCEAYGRKNSIEPIPCAISQLCANYFSNHVRCQINDAQIMQLTVKPVYMQRTYTVKPLNWFIPISLQPFTCKNKLHITFKCFLTCFNDSIRFNIDIDKKNKRKLHLSNKSQKEKVTCLKFYYEVYCKETNSHWKGRHCATTSLLYPSDFSCWNNIMKVSDCINVKKLTFYYVIDILEITYTNKVYNYKKPIIINKTFEFEWNINKKQLTLYRNYVPNKFVWCSNMKEHEIFSAWFAPRGFSKASNKMFYGVDITGLFPDGIEKMNVKITVKDSKNNFMFESVNLFHENSVGGKTVSNIVYGNGTYSMNNVE